MPEPGPGEVVLRIEAALTCGTDVKTLRRGHPVMIPQVPTVFGHEFAGTVAAVGPRRRGHPGGRPGGRGELGAVRAVPALPGGPAEPLRGPALRQRRLRRVHRAAAAPRRARTSSRSARALPAAPRGLRRAAGLRAARHRAGPGRAGHDGGGLRPRPARLPARLWLARQRGARVVLVGKAGLAARPRARPGPRRVRGRAGGATPWPAICGALTGGRGRRRDGGRDRAARGVGAGHRCGRAGRHRGILRRLRAGHDRPAGHAPGPLRGAHAGRGLPPHAGPDPPRGGAARVRGHRPGAARHPPHGSGGGAAKRSA